MYFILVVIEKTARHYICFVLGEQPNQKLNANALARWPLILYFAIVSSKMRCIVSFTETHAIQNL